MEKIKLIFIGTADIGTEVLERLSQDDRFKVMLVVTTKDKPAGRKLELTPSPIKVAADRMRLPIYQPEDINSEESLEIMRTQGADMMVLMAYGQILKRDTLEITPYGCLNVHASLLPKYRGASPIQTALLNQDIETGISLMKMVEQMDAGPVYDTFKLLIAPEDDSETLTRKIARLTADEIPNALVHIYETNPIPFDQNENEVTYVKKINKERGALNWNDDVRGVDAKIRALYGWPGTFTFFHGKRLKIIKAKFEEKPVDRAPGTVTREGITCRNGYIKPTELQLEGRNIQSFAGFINGNPDFVGTKL